MADREQLDEIMTLSEVAEYLKVAEKTVLRMVHRNEIPSLKIASQWRFLKPVIDDWLISKMKDSRKSDLVTILETDPSILPVSRFTDASCINTDIHPGTKSEVLKQLLRPLKEQKVLENDQEFLEKLLQREHMASTALGRGVAVPHVRDPETISHDKPLLGIGICSKGTYFDSIDGDKTYLFFLIYINSVAVHLRTLSKLSLLFQKDDFIKSMKEAKTAAEVMGILIQFDSVL